MRYLKLFENFNDDDLIKFLSNRQDITLINNKELDYLTQSDIDLIYRDVISKFLKRFNLRVKSAKGYNILSSESEEDEYIDFTPNRLPTFRWETNYGYDQYIQVNKYQDDWWLFIFNIDNIFNPSKETFFGTVRFFLCDTRDALPNLYEWLIDNKFLVGGITESVSDYIDGGLMKQVSANQFYEIEEDHKEETEPLSQTDIYYLKSKMKNSGVPYSSWGLFTDEKSQQCKIIFRLNRRLDYSQNLHYTSIKFEKYRDDFWLCEILSDNGRGDDYLAMMNIIIDSKEGLEEFFKWVKEPTQSEFFRIDSMRNSSGMFLPTTESLNLYSRPESDAVQVFESWRDFDEFCESKKSEQFNQSELPMISKLVDSFIEIYNDHCDNKRMWSENKLRAHSKFHLNYDNTVAEWEVAILDRVVAYDYTIHIYKFADDWWVIQFHLPHVSSPEGGDTVYFLCDSRDGLRDSELVFKNYIES